MSEKKRGSLFWAFAFFSFFIGMMLVLLIGAAYVYRDHLLLELIRNEGAKKFGFTVFDIQSLKTHPIGAVSIEIGELTLQTKPSAPMITAKRVVVAVPENILQLLETVRSGDVLQIKSQIVGLDLNLSNRTSEKPPPSPSTLAPGAVLGIPVGLDAELELRESAIRFGSREKPAKLGGLTGVIRVTAKDLPRNNQSFTSTGQLALLVDAAGMTKFPIRAEWTAKGTAPDLESLAIDISSLSVSALGLTVKSSASLQWPAQDFTFKAQGATTDLGSLPLDKTESEALGLVGRLEGSAEISIDAKGNLTRALAASGVVRLKNGVLPFDRSKQTPKPHSIVGPALLEFDFPYRLEYDFAGAKLQSIGLDLASFKADLSKCRVEVPGYLNKAVDTPLVLSAQATAQGETIDFGPLHLQLANLSFAARGRLSLAPDRRSNFELSLSLPSLLNWPRLLPLLSSVDAGGMVTPQELDRAKGSLQVKASVELPLASQVKPLNDVAVKIEELNLGGLEYPLNMRFGDSESRRIVGVLRGQLSAAGSAKQSAGGLSWAVQRAVGTLDLKDTLVVWDDLLNKPRGQDLSATVKAMGDQTSARIETLSLKAKDLSLTANGTAQRGKTPETWQIDWATSTRASLFALYSLIPKLQSFRGKAPSGNLAAEVKLRGPYSQTAGLVQSPLAPSGTLSLKLPVFLLLSPQAKPAAATAAVASGEPDADPTDALRWPVLANANIAVTADIGQVKLATTTIRGVTATARLQGDAVTGQAKMASAFGGQMAIDSLKASALSKQTDASLAVQVGGRFSKLSLSALGEFFDPKLKSLVAGHATGQFSAGLRPLNKAPLQSTSTVSGTLQIADGFISSVRLDQLINQKLAAIPGLGSSAARVASKGATANISAQYRYENSALQLGRFLLTTPEKNALELTGSLKSDFWALLEGKAALTDAPVGGSVRAANSDASGRLVVPVKIDGFLNNPNISIAESAIKEMLAKTLEYEAGKAKKHFEGEAKKVIDQKKNEAVDRVKEELKKRGIGF